MSVEKLYWPVPAAHVKLTGADRVPFLHGQATGNVTALPVGGRQDLLLLNPRGQLEFQARLVRRPDDLYLSADGAGGALLDRLARYIVFDDVKLEDLNGTLALVRLNAPPAPLGPLDEGRDVQEVEGPFGRVLVARAGGFWEATLLAEHLPEALEALRAAGFQQGTPERWRAERVNAWRVDLLDDAFTGLLPQEVGLGGLVADNKGCYVGQETMARLDARGHLNRGLARVHGSGPLPAGRELQRDGRAAGRLGAPVAGEDGWAALAVLPLEAGAGLSVDGQPVAVERPAGAAGGAA